jgi:poly-gamma-glutamate synthesis protein (capsule biosynthesis protein)
MSFCASPKYIASLEAIGVDIIELTGNHNNDYGADENTSTIET